MEKYHILQLITQGHYKEAKEALEQYKEQFVIDTDKIGRASCRERV